MCPLGTFLPSPQDGIDMLSMCYFPDSTYQEAESRFRSRSSEQFCPPISPWNFMDPKRGL